MKTSRRRFLSQAAALPAILPAAVRGRPAPSERITMAILGTGNQGTNDMKMFLSDDRVQVVAVCDVNRQSAGYWNGGVAGRDPAKAIVEKKYAEQTKTGEYKGCAAVEDFREIIARKDIDVVATALPDHWHAITAIEALRAGKDVYCQKPLSLTVAEGRAMSDAVKQHKRIFQTGSQQRSDARFRHAAELVRNGRLGKLHTIRCGQPPGWPDFGKTADRKKPEPVPEGFNYDLWLGPAPAAPYCPARCHVNFRWIFDYSGGQVTDWGGHHPDIAMWAMGTEKTGPLQIKNAKGTRPADELYNTFTEYYFEALFANGTTLVVSHQYENGVKFEGERGWIFVSRGRIAAEPKAILDEKIGDNETRLYRSMNHYRNFIDCVISRQEPAAPCEAAHRSITVCHLGNIAMLLGRDLKWDPEREQVVDDPKANEMLRRPYRAPWKLEG
jgi:predicted dehydrogenase